jgi:hypothetical protein
MIFEIEKITLPAEKDTLLLWKKRNPSIVPEFALNWKGNGVSNGYGFGEWVAEKYFRSQGYYVINDEFDLFSLRSKYKVYNNIIAQILGIDKVEQFSMRAKELYKAGYKIENLDLFIFNTNTCFFAEVKKGTDFLRDPQKRFMFLSENILTTPCKEIYISDEISSVSKIRVQYDIEMDL